MQYAIASSVTYSEIRENFSYSVCLSVSLSLCLFLSLHTWIDGYHRHNPIDLSCLTVVIPLCTHSLKNLHTSLLGGVGWRFAKILISWSDRGGGDIFAPNYRHTAAARPWHGLELRWKISFVFLQKYLSSYLQKCDANVKFLLLAS